jgi:hypothetical protein
MAAAAGALIVASCAPNERVVISSCWTAEPHLLLLYEGDYCSLHPAPASLVCCHVCARLLLRLLTNILVKVLHSPSGIRVGFCASLENLQGSRQAPTTPITQHLFRWHKGHTQVHATFWS